VMENHWLMGLEFHKFPFHTTTCYTFNNLHMLCFCHFTLYPNLSKRYWYTCYALSLEKYMQISLVFFTNVTYIIMGLILEMRFLLIYIILIFFKVFMWINSTSCITTQLGTKIATKIKCAYDHHGLCVIWWIKCLTDGQINDSLYKLSI
jgi:hypothetical protein